jgi:hypothetical protein
MDSFDDSWLSNGKNIAIAFQIDGCVFETLAPIIFFRQLITLNHGTHGAVNDQYSFFQFLLNASHIDGFNRKTTVQSRIESAVSYTYEPVNVGKKIQQRLPERLLVQLNGITTLRVIRLNNKQILLISLQI